MSKAQHVDVEGKIDEMVQLIRSAGYAPQITISTAELPLNLAKQAGIRVPAEAKEQSGQHVYVQCWNFLVLASCYPLVPGGLYCGSVAEGCLLMDQMVRRFCYDYWKGDGKRPTKRELGVK